MLVRTWCLITLKYSHRTQDLLNREYFLFFNALLKIGSCPVDRKYKSPFSTFSQVLILAN